MRIKAVTAGIVLASVALGSTALTLGRARGAAWIGQPLELLVPVQLDAGQFDAAVCAEADVFHGDSRQDASRVLIQMQATDQADTFNLRLSSSSLVDEPVVTVYLRAGCSQKSARKYVLLADYPNDAAAPLSRTVTPAAAPTPLVIPVEAPAATAASANTAPANAVGSSPRPVAAVAKESAKATPKETAKVEPKEIPKAAPKEPAPKKDLTPKAEKLPAVGKPRLRLDPIEVLNERVKTLEASTTGSTVQDDLTRDGQKMQTLQGDLKTLLEQAVKNEASLMAMRERLDKAESERVPVAFVYVLGTLVLLCLAALAYLLSRRPRQIAWENSVAPAYAAPVAAASAARAAPTTASIQDMDVDLVDLDPASFDSLMGQPQAAKRG
jgi:hypothetical protein